MHSKRKDKPDMFNLSHLPSYLNKLNINFMANNYGAIAVSVLVGLSHFLFFYLLVPVRFQTNDDVVMMMIASGGYSGEPSSHLVFVGYYLSLFISFLYEAMPQHNWYAISQLSILSSAIIIIVYRLHRNGFDSWSTGIISSPISILLIFVLSAQLQFTTTAAVGATVGLWLALLSRNVLCFIIGILFFILGVSFRFEASMLAVGISLPLLLAYQVKYPARAKYAFFCAAICVSSAFILEYSSRMQYKELDPNYYSLNLLRGIINDSPLSDISDDLPQGISTNDLDLIRNFFIDVSVTGVPELREILGVIAEKQKQVSLSDVVNSAAKVVKKLSVVLFLLVCGAIAYTAQDRRTKLSILFLIFLVVSALASVQYLATLKDRVIYAALAGAVIPLSLLGISLNSLKGRRYVNLILAISIIALVEASVSRISDNTSYNDRFRNQIGILEKWDGATVAFAADLKIEGMHAFSSDVQLLDRDIFFLGWMAGHPLNERLSSHLTLLEDDVILLVLSEGVESITTLLANSFWENYSLRVAYSILADDGETSLVKFAIRQPKTLSNILK